MSKEKKLKRIPTKFVVLGGLLATTLLVFIIYFIIALSNASMSKVLESAIGIDDIPKIVKADKQGVASFSNATSTTKKYSYSSDSKDIKIGLVCHEYQDYTPNKNDEGGTDGHMYFFVGFEQLDKTKNITVESATIIAADRWAQESSKVSVTSSYYSSTLLKKDSLTFYSSSTSYRTVSLDSCFKYPNRHLLNLVKCEHPVVYVYCAYKVGSVTKTTLVEFEYDDYFIPGQTILK